MKKWSGVVMAKWCRGGPCALPGGGKPHPYSWIWVVAFAALVSCTQEPKMVEPEGLRDPVEARAAVDRAVATTGDLITYRVLVDYQSDLEIEIPEAGAEIAGFRLVDLGREEPREQKGRIIDERWYQLRADLVGSYVLPPVEVGYRKAVAEGEEPAAWETLSTSEIFVEVESVLPLDGEADDIRDLKPLRRIQPPMPWLWIVLGLVGVAILAVLIGLYLRRRARLRELVPLIPPHELAFESLEVLRRTDFNDPVAVRRFYFDISEVIRAYVEGRFGLNATDLTTEEIVISLPDLSELQADQNSILQSFLMDTDQVKFAHHEPSKDDIEGTYERALSFVEATHPVEEETTTEPEEVAA